MVVRRRTFPLARALAVGLAALATLPGVAAGRAAHGVRSSVPRAGVALPRGARELGAEPAGTPLRATIALKPRDPGALARYAAAVSDPGSPEYHAYLTVAQFARRFAPTAAERRLVRAALRTRGLSVGATSPNDLSIVVRGSARATGDAFSTVIDRVALRDGALAEAPAGLPRLPGPAGAIVQGVVGLDSVAPSATVVFRRGAIPTRRRPDATRSDDATRPTPDVARPHVTAAGPQSCAAATSAAASQGAYTAGQIAARYGLSNYYAAGDEGQGETIALYELEPFSASDIAGYQSCLGTNATVEVESVDGGAGSGSGSGEAATDVEDAIGLAPRATIRVYEGPQTGYGAYGTYSAIVADDAAQVVSTSWGLCEAQLGSSAARSENTLFQEAAAQGQTVLAAAGDSGADDCANGSLAVDDPASQPYVTGVGGTSIHGSVDTVWDNALGAGGGGASQFWPRPSWQTGVPAQSAVTCTGAGDACREVPDLSADADPATGYVVYFKGAWRTVGGTSVSAPTIAALAALADASPGCAGRPLGFLAPNLYTHAADLSDVTSGSNSFDGVTGFSAGPGYDMASGLGTPTAALGPALCGDALTIAPPAAQSLTVGRAATIAAHATSTRGAAIRWSATGLPAGLTIAPSTGQITGTPTAAGRFAVALSALDADGATATASFAATVAAAPASTSSSASDTATSRTIATQRLRTVSARVGRRLHVRLRVSGATGPGLRFSATGLPRGLRVSPTTGVLSGTPRSSGRRSVTIQVTHASSVVAVARVRVVVSGRAPRTRIAKRRRHRPAEAHRR